MQLVISSLTKTYSNRDVLKGLSTTFEGPALIGILGPSGSGKSTLLSLISGAERPDSGNISFFKNDKNTIQIVPTISWIVQASPGLMHRTVEDNIVLGALIKGFEPNIVNEESQKFLKIFELEPLAKNMLGDLSGGEKQRVAVARALAENSDLILADEPTASLDAENRKSVCDALERAAQGGATVLVATHDLYVASRCSSTFELMAGEDICVSD